MAAPEDINGLVPDPQQASLLSKLLSKSAQMPGGSSFQMLLAATMAQIRNQAASPLNGAAHLLQASRGPMVNQGNDAGFKQILATVLKYEGSAYVQKDGSESSKFGILQSTAREFGYKGNIKNMSRAQAEGIYKKIWDKSGAASLPYPLSLVHFDTYVNSPAAAMKMLGKSGGSTETYIAMRARRYTRLAELRPERYGKYLKGWMNRVTDLHSIASEHTVLNRFANNDTETAGVTESTIIEA